MNRREFVATMGASGASLLLPALAKGATSHRAATARFERIGLELYAVRNAMKASPERTLAAVRAIGYTDVELLWSFKNFGQTDKEVRDTLKKEGLKAPSAHIAPEALLSRWDEQLGIAKMLGHQLLIVPSLPAEANRSIDVWKLWADRFNAAGEEARRAGIWLAFHNEPDHQKKLQGEVPIEVFAQALDPKLVKLQLDVGNMLMGGGDPMDFHSRYRARIASYHLKNVIADRSRDTELSRGTFDLRTFLGSITDLAKKPCYVEQEGASDELASAKANWEYLKGLEF
jgi:sugar phosphate isomerase/epimerase